MLYVFENSAREADLIWCCVISAKDKPAAAFVFDS